MKKEKDMDMSDEKKIFNLSIMAGLQNYVEQSFQKWQKNHVTTVKEKMGAESFKQFMVDNIQIFSASNL